MMHLIPHNRIHIPNVLAILAAVLLLISSVAGVKTNQEIYSSGQEIKSSASIESKEDDSINDAVENKRRGLNFGLSLFRR
jgi:hypothetical protein